MWPLKNHKHKNKEIGEHINELKIGNFKNRDYEKINKLTRFQLMRYGIFRRSDLKKEKIKKIISQSNVVLKNITSMDPLIIAIKGLAKIYIGEKIEKAKQVMFEIEDTSRWMSSPIQNNHLIKSLNSKKPHYVKDNLI
ncbi:transcription initiation factor IID SU beta [Guillardia theta]|uniref:Transcription initiation factor IID SU beta n=1 Tax=Guillardia theta TaxID=55529 RepID=Q9AW46_GUITH|nr:transcription initiation factor IID SU beta [Guillardia theta]CAC27024.1 transcription initiation factor IID SU beta [Guillardia theta]|mmetsp:Transcript_17293/g.57214  ORF Transcript_17293/g.57214 Transcript_17293/m.57214 type:complete len:138 (-) Transcript_17293:2927-3340(-)